MRDWLYGTSYIRQFASSTVAASGVGKSSLLIVEALSMVSAKALLDQLVRCQVTTFCAAPTVWRMLIQHDLRAWPVQLREATSAGKILKWDYRCEVWQHERRFLQRMG